MDIQVKGKIVDEEARCIHYHSALDVVAIKFRCCNLYYPCYYCHEEDAGHNDEVWKKDEFHIAAILCGVCKQEMTISAYQSSNHRCPYCQTAFNPKCSNHDHLYFEQ